MRSLNVTLRVKGFTLIEVMVVFALICILTLILVPVLDNAIESSRQTACGKNMKAIGVAVIASIHKETLSCLGYVWDEHTHASTPHMTGNKRITNHAFTAAWVPVSHNYYALIHNSDANPSNFICPSDKHAIPDNATRDVGGNKYWDFAGNVNLSYSFQAPYGADKNPLDNAIPKVVVMGDRTPFEQLAAAEMNGGQPGDTLPSSPSPGRWSTFSSETPTEDSRIAMSQNHGGDAFVGLRFSGEAVFSYTANCGVKNDCVYTPGGATVSQWSDATFGPHTIGTAFGIGAHLSNMDTFLIDTPDP